jgi:hypothetical protein
VFEQELAYRGCTIRIGYDAARDVFVASVPVFAQSFPHDYREEAMELARECVDAAMACDPMWAHAKTTWAP